MKEKIWILLFWAGICFACDPCAECGEPLVYDPYVKVVFYNQDSAVILETDLSIVDDSIKVLDSLNEYSEDTLTVLSDSLLIIVDLISNGDDSYKVIQALFNDYIDSVSLVLQELDTLDKYINIKRIALNDILNDIEDGYVKPEMITLVENGFTLTYEDSAAFFNLPVLLNDQNQTTYQITLEGETYELTIQYTKYETIDNSRTVYIEVANTDTVSHTFDSINFTCKTTQCISDEATIAAYF